VTRYRNAFKIFDVNEIITFLELMEQHVTGITIIKQVYDLALSVDNTGAYMSRKYLFKEKCMTV
jgi:hypothetical protein